jgi:amino-acid N-acetyltransferase
MTSSTLPLEITRIRAATTRDVVPVLALLREASLSLPGVEEHFGSFVVAERGSRIVGAMGLELRGGEALLRSAVVAPDARGTGVAAALYAQIEEVARVNGVRTLVLLTTAAQGYWARHGFAPIARDDVPTSVTLSEEFRGACPASATAMLLTLD